MQVLRYRGISFDELLKIQEECVFKVSEDKSASFLIVSEPLPTFTRGVSAKDTDLLWDALTLKEKGVVLCSVSRGGKWTYHGPGQIVVFPILQLEEFGFSNRGTQNFVETLSEAVQNFLSIHNITSCIKTTPYGIYVGENKICSFGVRVERGITSHGLSFYFSSQKEPFKGIHPCGEENAQLTSLWEEGGKLTWLDASNQLVSFIKKSFKLE